MKLKLTLIALAATALMSTSAVAADEIQAVFHYPAGGGVDSSTAALWTAIEKTSDARVKKIYYKSCAEAMDHVAKTPNSLLVTESGAVNLDGATTRCPDARKAGMQLVSLVTSSSGYLCTAPGKTNLTVQDLLGNRSLKVGAGKHPTTSGVAEAFLKDIGSKSRVIPYANVAELRASAAAGDVDMVYGVNGIAELVAAGSKCLAASSSDNPRKLPALSTFTKSPFPSFYLSTAVFTVHPNDKITSTIQRAMRSVEFQQDIDRRQVIHLGLGTTNTVKQQEQIYRNDYQTGVGFESKTK